MTEDEVKCLVCNIIYGTCVIYSNCLTCKVVSKKKSLDGKKCVICDPTCECIIVNICEICLDDSY